MAETRAAVGHMPFPGHRTQKEVREDEEYPLKFKCGHRKTFENTYYRKGRRAVGCKMCIRKKNREYMRRRALEAKSLKPKELPKRLRDSLAQQMERELRQCRMEMLEAPS